MSALAVGMYGFRAPLRPVDGTAATTKFVDIVHEAEPEATEIRYTHYRQGPGIPDPGPADEVAVEFRRAGTVCHGRLDSLTGDNPQLTDVECGVGLLARDRVYVEPTWAAASGLLAIVTVVLAGCGRRQRRRRRFVTA